MSKISELSLAAINLGKKALVAIKDSALWLGRSVKNGVSYAISKTAALVSWVWNNTYPHVKSAVTKAVNFAKTSQGKGVLLASLGSAFLIASHTEKFSGSENTYKRIGLNLAGVILIAAGALSFNKV